MSKNKTNQTSVPNSPTEESELINNFYNLFKNQPKILKLGVLFLRPDAPVVFPKPIRKSAYLLNKRNAGMVKIEEGENIHPPSLPIHDFDLSTIQNYINETNALVDLCIFFHTPENSDAKHAGAFFIVHRL